MVLRSKRMKKTMVLSFGIALVLFCVLFMTSYSEPVAKLSKYETREAIKTLVGQSDTNDKLLFEKGQKAQSSQQAFATSTVVPDVTKNPFVYEQKKSIDDRTGDSPFVLPKWDTNCLRTIPGIYTDGKGESSITIPPLEVLKSMDEEVVACIFQRYVTSLQRHCTQPEMIGRFHKINHKRIGGWNVCLDQKYKPTVPCIVYSFSVKYDDYSFAVGMASMLRCEVHRFNQSEKDVKRNDSLVLSHNTWIGTSNENNRKPLSAIMETLGHKDRVLDVLTLDIEGEEWEILKELISSGIIKKIRQLSLVIHGPAEDQHKQAYIDRLMLLQSLYELGFRIFWANRDWDVQFKLHPKRSNAHILNLVQDVDAPPQHLTVPSDDVLENMEPDYVGEFFSRYCMSTQILCKEIVRMGLMHSGGWDICHDKEWRPQSPCLVYSFGIKFDFSFDDDMSEFYGCEVHSFDPSMNTTDYKQAPRVYYHDVGITGPNNTADISSKYKDWKTFNKKWRLETLHTLKNELGHTNRHLDILKVDVEWWEWPSVPEMIRSGTLKDVTQFLIEFHIGFLADSHEKYKDYLKFMRNLYIEGYRIFWAHRNPYCIYNAEDTSRERAACFEVYFLNINKKRN